MIVDCLNNKIKFMQTYITPTYHYSKTVKKIIHTTLLGQQPLSGATGVWHPYLP